MSVVVFCGPTISAADASAVLENATCLPPAGQGDLYRAGRRMPNVIALIDGTFATAPAVWHKEILWALSQGIHVFGSSSMGALRAAELSDFGMCGVGRVFEWFRSGFLEDDDEVAVSHGDGSVGYRSVSEAMVNVRATLAAAVGAEALDDATAYRFMSLAKAMYYADRNYPRLLEVARSASIPEMTIQSFATFLERGRVNQKRTDALAMLHWISDNREALESRRGKPSFHFEHTDAWEEATSEAEKRRAEGSSKLDDIGVDALLEELRLEGQRISAIRRGMLLRALANREAGRAGMKVTAEVRDVLQEQFRNERGLAEVLAVRSWLDRNEISEADFGRFLEGEARLTWLENLYRDENLESLTAELLVSGELEGIRARASNKQRLLAAHGLADPELSDAGLEAKVLLEWYFEKRLNRPVPPQLTSHLREVGLSSEEDLCREALREYLFLRLTSGMRKQGALGTEDRR